MNSRDVAAQACDDGCYFNQFAWLIVKLHLDGTETSALHQSTVDDAVQDGYIDVTAAHYADGFLSLDWYLVVHHGCHASCTSAFGYHLLTLYEFQDGCTDLILAHGNNFVHVVGAGLEGEFSRFLYGNAIGYGSYGW